MSPQGVIIAVALDKRAALEWTWEPVLVHGDAIPVSSPMTMVLERGAHSPPPIEPEPVAERGIPEAVAHPSTHEQWPLLHLDQLTLRRPRTLAEAPVACACVLYVAPSGRVQEVAVDVGCPDVARALTEVARWRFEPVERAGGRTRYAVRVQVPLP